MPKKKLKDHPLFVEWAKFVKKHGGCVQCQYPWHDGDCDCQWGRTNAVVRNGMGTLAYRLSYEFVL
jgi:hypothetical protein